MLAVVAAKLLVFCRLEMIEYPRPDLSPEEFELFTKRMLDAASSGLHEYRSEHREIIPGADGEYEIDITVRFSALGADYLNSSEVCDH